MASFLSFFMQCDHCLESSCILLVNCSDILPILPILEIQGKIFHIKFGKIFQSWTFLSLSRVTPLQPLAPFPDEYENLTIVGEDEWI